MAAVLRDLERKNQGEAPEPAPASTGGAEQYDLQTRVDKLIESYRLHGHMAATLDPLARPRNVATPGLEPAYFGLRDEHMDRKFDPGVLMPGGQATLRQIWTRLQNTYCRNIGVEYWHIQDLEQRIDIAPHHPGHLRPPAGRRDLSLLIVHGRGAVPWSRGEKHRLFLR